MTKRPGNVPSRWQIGDATVAELSAGLRGHVVRAGDGDYDEARAIWNGAHDKHPAVVVRCAGVADVIRTVAFARSEGRPLSVRAGGHSVAGFSTVDDGVVLDLSPMRGISVDPHARIATTQTGSLWHDLDTETQQFGLAVTGGLVSTTGVSGFTLGGGIGWLSRRCGLAADNLRAAELVTADGQLVRADADHDPELLWALRGGGGNFGVVTAMELDLHPIGTEVFAGVVVFAADSVDPLLRAYAAACRRAPRELTTLVKLTSAPPMPELDPSVHGGPVVVVGGCFAGDLDRADEVTRELRELASPLADSFAARPYLAWQHALDPLFPRGLHNYFRAAFVADLGTSETAGLVRGFEGRPTGLSEIIVHHLGGAVGETPCGGSAFAVRDREFIVNVVARTDGPDGFADVVNWARNVVTELGPGAPTYVNFTGEGSAERVRASYPPDTHRRLVAVKDRYDPANLFRLNQNIEPSSEAV
jgi:FAD/FMN-containing dehydrogenase